MKLKLNETRELKVEDFIKKEGFEYEFNDTKLNCVADFYEIKKEEKEALLTLYKEFKEVTKAMVDQKINLKNYLEKIENLNMLANKYPNIIILMNGQKEFVVRLKAELKNIYQADKKLTKDSQPKTKGLLALYGIKWEESERGWGIRPDGYSFHRSPEEAKEFIEEYQKKLPKEIPDEYSRPSYTTPKLIEVSEGLYDYVTEKGSVWLVPNSEKAYKTYDASHLWKSNKNKIN